MTLFTTDNPQHGHLFKSPFSDYSLIMRENQIDLVRRFKQLFSRYQRSRDLIAVGAYQAGADPLLDEAVRMYPALEAFLQQKIEEQADFEGSLDGLYSLFGTPRG